MIEQNAKDKKQVGHITVKTVRAPEQAQAMAARYIRALYGISMLEFARQMEKETR